jgi:hypothetical protein
MRRDWDALARAFAEDAHKNHFHSRRGVWYCEDLDVVALYNNNPYRQGWHYRDRETEEMRRELQEAGIATLAYATYPAEGEEGAGYTYALVLDCSRDRMKQVDEIRHRAFQRTWERLAAAE